MTKYAGRCINFPWSLQKPRCDDTLRNGDVLKNAGAVIPYVGVAALFAINAFENERGREMQICLRGDGASGTLCSATPSIEARRTASPYPTRGTETISVGKDEAGHRRHSHRCVHCLCVGSRDMACQTPPYKIVLVAIFIYSSRGSL